MERIQKSNWTVSWFVRFSLTLAVGFILGAYVYSRYIQRTLPLATQAVSTVTESASEPELSSEFVQVKPATQSEIGIEVEEAGIRNLRDTLPATAVVAEDPGRVAHIRPLARGIIEKSFVRLGDRVMAGDSLVEYDNIELGLAIGEYLTAQAEFQRSLTDLEVKKTILDRGREMLKVGAIARTAYDLREAEFKDAEAKTAGSRAAAEKIEEQIHRFGMTDQDLANLDTKEKRSHRLTHSILRAPFSGIVTAHHASVGEVVEPSSELLAITDMSILWVLADVFERDLSHVKSGQSVRVRVASYPGKKFSGKITYISDSIDPRTRTAKVRCVVDNNSGLLKLEMFATIEIPIDRIHSVLAVPDSAIQEIEGKPYVFVRTTATTFQKRAVLTGFESAGYTEIRSGIQKGELIATRGSFVVKTAFLRNLIGESE